MLKLRGSLQRNSRLILLSKRRILIHSVLIVTTQLSLSVFAEDDNSILSMSIEDLLKVKFSVASKFDESELEAGSTVEAISNRQWKDYGAENLSEAISHLPGTMVYPVLWGGSAIAIRGYSSSLSVRGVATLLDGIPMNSLRNGSALYEIRGYTTASLDRIEMIRGPGSALYGSDAFHGVLSMKTYESHQDQTQLNLNLSNEGLQQANLNFSKINDNGVNFNASVTSIDQAAQDIPYSYTIPGTSLVENSERANSYKAHMAVFKLDVPNSDRLKTSYAVYFKGHNSIESVSGGQSLSPFGSILMDNDISDGSDNLYALKAAFEKQFDKQISFEGKAFHWNSESTYFTDLSSIGFGGSLGKVSEDLNGLELTLKQPNNNWNTRWTLGLSYKKGKIHNNDSILTTTDADRTEISRLRNEQSGFSRNVKSLIFSAKSNFLADSFQFVYGGRIDKYSDFGNQTTPRYGLIYLPNNNSSFKLLYGEAFRATTSAELFGTKPLKGNLNLKPEVIKTSELVYIYQSDFWKINLTYFKSQWTNGIILNPISEPDFTAEYVNIGHNQSDGWELTYRGALDNWRWDINGSWVSSKAITADGDVDYVAFPEQIYNLNFGYNFADKNMDLYVTNRLQMSAKEGPISSNVPNPKDLNDYSATDVTFDWGLNDNLNLQVGIRNLFDRDNIIPAVWNNENGIRTLGRYFQASFSYTL